MRNTYIRSLFLCAVLLSAPALAGTKIPPPFSDCKLQKEPWGLMFIREQEIAGFNVITQGPPKIPASIQKTAGIKSANIGYGPLEFRDAKKSKEPIYAVSKQEATLALALLKAYSFEPSYSGITYEVTPSGELMEVIQKKTRLLNHFCSFGLWITLTDNTYIYLDSHIGDRYIHIRSGPELKDDCEVDNQVYASYFAYLNTKYKVQ